MSISNPEEMALRWWEARRSFERGDASPTAQEFRRIIDDEFSEALSTDGGLRELLPSLVRLAKSEDDLTMIGVLILEEVAWEDPGRAVKEFAASEISSAQKTSIVKGLWPEARLLFQH